MPSEQSNTTLALPLLVQAAAVTMRTKSQDRTIISKDLNEVHNCASQISNQLLIGPSIINAPPPAAATKNKNSNMISLPSINELDNMIDSTGRMMRILDGAKHKWFIPPSSSMNTRTNNTNSSASTPVTQYRAVVSNNSQIISVVNQDGHTTKRSLKRQRATSANTTNKKHQNKCHSCKSTETPEWRKGPLGPRTLCNACGLIWTKLCKQQEEDDNSRRKFKKSINSSPEILIEDCNTTTSSDSMISSPQSSSTTTFLKDNNEINSGNNKKKLALSFLLS